jgi:hypothetical protein
MVHPCSNFGFIVSLKDMKAFTSFSNWLSSVYTDSAVSMTLLSFDSAVSLTSLNFDLTVSMTPLSFDSAVSMTPQSHGTRSYTKVNFNWLSGVNGTARFWLSGVNEHRWDLTQRCHWHRWVMTQRCPRWFETWISRRIWCRFWKEKKHLTLKILWDCPFKENKAKKVHWRMCKCILYKNLFY